MLRKILKKISAFNSNDGGFDITLEKSLIVVFVIAFVTIAGIGVSKHGAEAVNSTNAKMDAAPAAIDTGISSIVIP